MSSGWCPDHAICLEWIERRALELVENFQEVDTVYMSLDIYKQFMKTMSSNVRGCTPGEDGFQTFHIVLCAGTLLVKPVPMLDNFCLVGTASTYDQLVRAQVDQAFEEVIMKDFDRV